MGQRTAACRARARQYRIDADDGKITALRTATKSLLTTLQNAATNAGDVYVSIIPFSKDVNVDSVNYTRFTS